MGTMLCDQYSLFLRITANLSYTGHYIGVKLKVITSKITEKRSFWFICIQNATLRMFLYLTDRFVSMNNSH